MGFPVNLRGPDGAAPFRVEVAAVFSPVHPAGDQKTVLSKITGLTLHTLPAQGHGAVGHEIPPPGVRNLPAGEHCPVCSKLIGLSLDFGQSRDQNAVLSKVIPAAVNVRKTNGKNAVFAEVVTVPLNVGKPGGHDALIIKIIGLSLNLLPAGDGITIPEVVSIFPQPQPAGNHGPVVSKVVALAVLLQPAGGHDAIVTKIVCKSVQLLPAGAGDAVGREIVGALRQLQPSGNRVCVKVPINPLPVFFNPAAAVDVVVIPVPDTHARCGQKQQQPGSGQNPTDFDIHGEPPRGYFRHCSTNSGKSQQFFPRVNNAPGKI